MATFDYPYRKSVNVTAWVLQIIVCLILLAASAWVMSVVSDDEYEDVLEGYGGILTAAAGIQIGLTGLTIVLDIAEMILIGRKRMHPAIYLTSACIKTLIWGIMFILSLISVSALSIILNGILLGTSILQLVYASRLVHRKRRGTLRGGNYKPAANPGSGGVETGYGGAGHAQGPVYGGPVPTYDNAAATPGYYQPQPQAGTEYKSPTTGAAPPPQYYGQGQNQAPGSYELDSRPHQYA